MRSAFALALLLAALPAGAETFKWVDEKGVTNYSSTPPASRTAKVIEERVSVIPADPSLATAIADMRAQAAKRAEYVEQEWIERGRLMAARPVVVAPPEDYLGASYYPTYYPAYYPAYPGYLGGSVRGFRPVSVKGPMRPSRPSTRPSSRPSGGRR